MDIIAAHREVGTYRGAAAMCGTTHKTVRRIIERQQAGGKSPVRAPRKHNYDGVAGLVAQKVAATQGEDLGQAAAAGRAGRRLHRVGAQLPAADGLGQKTWRREHHRGRRPAVWTPGEMLVIDWGAVGGLHVFCTVLVSVTVRHRNVWR